MLLLRKLMRRSEASLGKATKRIANVAKKAKGKEALREALDF